jgi:hypothetical protein
MHQEECPYYTSISTVMPAGKDQCNNICHPSTPAPSLNIINLNARDGYYYLAYRKKFSFILHTNRSERGILDLI